MFQPVARFPYAVQRNSALAEAEEGLKEGRQMPPTKLTPRVAGARLTTTRQRMDTQVPLGVLGIGGAGEGKTIC